MHWAQRLGEKQRAWSARFCLRPINPSILPNLILNATLKFSAGARGGNWMAAPGFTEYSTEVPSLQWMWIERKTSVHVDNFENYKSYHIACRGTMPTKIISITVRNFKRPSAFAYCEARLSAECNWITQELLPYVQEQQCAQPLEKLFTNGRSQCLAQTANHYISQYTKYPCVSIAFWPWMICCYCGGASFWYHTQIVKSRCWADGGCYKFYFALGSRTLVGVEAA